MLIFVLLSFLFLLVLPSYGFWVMEKYIALFFLPFILCVFYSIRKYDFLDIKITILKGIIFTCSLLSSYLVVKVFKKYSETLHDDFKKYWEFSDSSFFIEFIM